VPWLAVLEWLNSGIENMFFLGLQWDFYGKMIGKYVGFSIAGEIGKSKCPG
jgi:hypothetical protein